MQTVCEAGLWVLMGCVAWSAGGARAMEMSEEMAEMAKMVRDNCIGETGVDPALLAAVDGGAELMPDPKLKCYIKCTMETAGAFNDGVVDVDTLLGLLPDDFRQKIEVNFRACGTKTGADDCDTAFLTQQCWQQSNRAEYFLI